MEYVSKGTYSVDSDFLDELDNAVKHAKEDSTIKGVYMDYYDASRHYEDQLSEKDEQISELKQEIAESEEKHKQELTEKDEKAKKEKLESAKELLISGVSLKMIIKSFKLSEEEILLVKKEIDIN